jgi:hypothetical protein
VKFYFVFSLVKFGTGARKVGTGVKFYFVFAGQVWYWCEKSWYWCEILLCFSLVKFGTGARKKLVLV